METAVGIFKYRDIRIKRLNTTAKTSAKMATKYAQLLSTEYKTDASSLALTHCNCSCRGRSKFVTNTSSAFSNHTRVAV